MLSSEVFILVSCTVLVAVQPGLCSEIIGGKQVKPHSLPYMALVTNGTNLCGGTLIHPKWVLTAAHCGKLTTVNLGVHLRSKNTSWQVLKVIKNVVHGKYNEDTKVNDLQLLKLEPAAKETDTVKCLPLDKAVREPKAGSSCLVAGWGQTKPNVEEPSDVLMSVKVTVVDRTKCSKYYGSKEKITKEMICAGSEKADTCSGDSGGPIICNGAQVGVTSFGGVCGSKYPGVYAYLTKNHLKWIKKIIRTSEMQE